MTGFGNSKSTQEDINVEVSVKSVNGRFLDVRTHLPKEYAESENEIKKIVGQRIKRGTVDIYVSRRVGPSALQAKVSVQSELAKKWVKGYRQLAKDLKLSADLSMDQVVRNPDLITIEYVENVSAKEKGLLQKVLAAAVTSCQSEREREGKSLQKDLLSKLKELLVLSTGFEELKVVANEELAKRYEQRLAKTIAKGEIDPQRLAQEVVIQLDKSDIDEEITRLREHLRAMEGLIKGQESQGKKLDFYSQELLREVNTIGSKSQIARLTEMVVDAKAIIERIREQVQNVE